MYTEQSLQQIAQHLGFTLKKEGGNRSLKCTTCHYSHRTKVYKILDQKKPPKCPRCIKVAKYESKLQSIGYKLLSPFTTVRDKHLLYCYKCRLKFWSSIKHLTIGTSKNSCPSCKKQKIKPSTIDFRLSTTNIERVGKYTNTITPFAVRCRTCKSKFEVSYFQIAHSQFGACKTCRQESFKNKMRNNPTEMLLFMQALANFKIGECLSTKYLGAGVKYDFKCNVCGCKWKSKINNIDSGHWCPDCAIIERKQKLLQHSLEDLQDLAKKNGGLCTSEVYLGKHHKYNWKCSCGKSWKTTFISILDGQWCPRCKATRFKYEFTSTINIIRNRHGKLINEQQIELDSQGRLERFVLLMVECQNGHTFSITADRLFRGIWCQDCIDLTDLVTIQPNS